MGWGTGCDCLLLESSGSVPRPRSLAPQVPAAVRSVPPSPALSCPGVPAAPWHGDVRGASRTGGGYRDAAPLGAVLAPAPGGEASCQAGCSIQFALISQSASGSHVPKPISAAVAEGAGPTGVLSLPCPGLSPGRGVRVLGAHGSSAPGAHGSSAQLREPTGAQLQEPTAAQLSSGATGRSQALGGCCVGLSCRHGAEAVLSIPLARSASGRDTEAPERPGDKGGSVPTSLGAAQPGSPLPSHGLWLLLKLLLAAEESAAHRCEHKARLFCPRDAPPLLPRPSLAAGAARRGGTGWEAAHRLAKPPACRAGALRPRPAPRSHSPEPWKRHGP